MNFQCDRCGICCRTHRVPLTAFDLARLLEAPELLLGGGKKASEARSEAPDVDLRASSEGDDEAFRLLKYVEWLTPEEVDLLGEPESLVRAREGSALLVLKHTRAGSAESAERAENEQSACVFLHPVSGCTIHSSRPSSCRTYPFDRADASDARLGTHPAYLCPPETLVRQTVREANQDTSSENAWVQSVTKRDEEARLHADYIARWNLRQRTRTRLGKAPEGRERFLRWVLQVANGPQKPAQQERQKVKSSET